MERSKKLVQKSKGQAIESFHVEEKVIVRSIFCRDGKLKTSRMGIVGKASTRNSQSQDRLAALFESAWLRSTSIPKEAGNGRAMRLVDLFSGCGFFSLGVREACRALGLRFTPVVAIDTAEHAVKTYGDNFGLEAPKCKSVTAVLDGQWGNSATSRERRFMRDVGKIDIVVAGPPCQGNSNLNNITRRSDPKNALYERVARFAELVRPTNIIIENVPEVLYDEKNVVDQTFQELIASGYMVDHGVVDALDFGVPQSRKRHLMIASLDHEHSIQEIVKRYKRSKRTVKWAIGDLTKKATNCQMLDEPSKMREVTRARVEYLFSRNIYELPDAERPLCHQDGTHSYKSVYGRLKWNAPAQTITSGFGCMGQGRHVHPVEKRTLTPHEAARLQTIPDFFSFSAISKRAWLAESIGNAVPPKLAYVFALELLR